MQNKLISSLDAVHPLSAALKERINSIVQSKQIFKKDFLLREGQVSNYIYFIEEGFIRSYYIKGNTEVTCWFMGIGDFIISVNSFFLRKPSYESIQAVENSTVHFIHYDELQQLYKEFSEFNAVGRMLTTHYYILSEERLYSMRKQTAEERYIFLINKHPEILQKAPLTQIASYLGIALETLSRIRARK